MTGFCNNCKMSYEGKSCPICHGKKITSHTAKKVAIGTGKVVGAIAVAIAAIVLVGVVAAFVGNSDSPTIDQDNRVAPAIPPDERVTPFESAPKKITYMITSIPEIPDKSIPQNALIQAFDLWGQKNSDITFIQSDSSNADIVVKWLVFEPETHAGLATCTIPGNCIIDISLGANNCRNQYTQADTGLVTNTIMHEIGHTLGLEHTVDESHLMYGEGYVQSNFDTLGYTIPTPLDEYYVGQKKLLDELDSLESRQQSLQGQYDVLDSKIEQILAKYGMTRQMLDNNPEVSNSLYAEINPVISNLNELVFEMNPIVDEINDLVDTVNCYPNVEEF